MKKKLFSKREKVMLAILALIILFALYYFFIHQPIEEQKASANSEIENLDVQLPIIQAKVLTMNNMKAEMEELKNTGSYVDIPKYDNLSEIILFMNSVLQGRQNYELSFQDPYKDENDGFIHRIAKVSFSSSTYESVEEAIQMVQDAPFLLRINDLMIEPGSTDDTDLATANSVNVSLEITFYELDAEGVFKTESELSENSETAE